MNAPRLLSPRPFTPRMLTVAAAALLSGTALAEAQTVISREVSNEPVETVITSGPAGLTVTRRPLQTMAPPVVSTTPVFPTYGPSGEAYLQSWAPAPTGYVPAYPAPPAVAIAPPAPVTGGVTVRPYGGYAETVPVDVTRTVVIEESVDDPVPARTVRTVRRGTPPIMARAVEPEPRRTRTARRATSDPMALAPTQRAVIYRTLGQQTSYDPATLERVTPTYAQPYGQPAYAQPAYTQPYGWQPGYAGYAAVPTTRTVTYTVGSVVPDTVTLAPVPRQIVRQIPQTRGYQYAVVNGRVLLIDPTTGTVVADVVR